MKKKFGIGIIGCGEIAAAHGRAYRALADDCDIIAMSDTVEAMAKHRAQEFEVETIYTNYHDLLADPRVDAVAICTPHYLHAPMTIAAANAGKHVLVEKPMCMNVGEVQEMIYAAKKNGVRLTMSTEQVNPRHRFIKEHILPEIGNISFSFLVDFYYRSMAYYEKARWRGTWAREGGGIFCNQSIYTWDTFQWLLGGVDVAYGYWANLLHPNIEVEALVIVSAKRLNAPVVPRSVRAIFCANFCRNDQNDDRGRSRGYWLWACQVSQWNAWQDFRNQYL